MGDTTDGENKRMREALIRHLKNDHILRATLKKARNDRKTESEPSATQGNSSGQPTPKKKQSQTTLDVVCDAMKKLGGDMASTLVAIYQLWNDWVDKRDNHRDVTKVKTPAPPRVTKSSRREFRTLCVNLRSKFTALQAARPSESIAKIEEEKRLRDAYSKMCNAGMFVLPTEARDVMDVISAAILALEPLYDCCEYQDRDPTDPDLCVYDQYVTYYLLLYVPTDGWNAPDLPLFVLDSIREAYSSSAIYSRIEDCVKVLEAAAGVGVHYVQSLKAMESHEQKNCTNEFVKNPRRRLDIWLRAITKFLLNALLEKAKEEPLPAEEMTGKLCAIGAVVAMAFRQHFLQPGEDGQLQFFTARMFAQAGTPLYVDWMQVLYEISAEICFILTTNDSENEADRIRLIEDEVLDIIQKSDNYQPTDDSECPRLLDYIEDKYRDLFLDTAVDVQYVWGVLSGIKCQSHVDLPFYHADFVSPKEGFFIYHSTPASGSGKCENLDDVLRQASGQFKMVIEGVADWMSEKSRAMYLGMQGALGFDLVGLWTTSFSSDAAADRAQGQAIYETLQAFCTFELYWALSKEKKPMSTAEMLSLFRLAEKVNDQRAWLWLSGGDDADSDRLYAADWLLDLVRDCLSTYNKVPELTDELAASVSEKLLALPERFEWGDDKRKVLSKFKALPRTTELQNLMDNTNYPTPQQVVAAMLIVSAVDRMCFVPKGYIFVNIDRLVFDTSLDDDNNTWVAGWTNFQDSLAAYDIATAYRATPDELAIVAAQHGQTAVEGVLAIQINSGVKAIMDGSAEEESSLANIPPRVPDSDALPQVQQLRLLIEKLASDAPVNNKRKRGMPETDRDSIVINLKTAIGSIEAANEMDAGKKELLAACTALKDVVGTLTSNEKPKEANIVQSIVDELNKDAADMLDEKDIADMMECDTDDEHNSEADEEEKGFEELMLAGNLSRFFELFDKVTEEEGRNDADPFTPELVDAYGQQTADMVNRAIDETTAEETKNAGNGALVVKWSNADPTVMYSTLRSGRTRGEVHKVAPTKPASERLKVSLEDLMRQRTGVRLCFERNESQPDITSQFTMPLRLSAEHCARFKISYNAPVPHDNNLEGAHSYSWLPQQKNTFTTSVDQSANRAAAIKQARTILSRVAYAWFTETATNANAIYTPSDPAAEDEALEEHKDLAEMHDCLNGEDDMRYADGTDAADGRAEAAHDRHDEQINATQNLTNIQNVMLALTNQTPGNTNKVAKPGTCFIDTALAWEARDEDDDEL